MLFTFINEIDRSADVKSGSISYISQLQQRADSCAFKIFQNTQPSENEDLKIYKGDTIASAAGATINLNGYYSKEKSIFYPEQILCIRIGDSDEELVTVQSYDEDNLQIILESAPSGSISTGDKIGQIIFGGVISRVRDKNIGVLQNLEYTITGVDYSKIFDKKLISNAWEGRGSRYIINDFCNSTINYNRLIDNMEYDDNIAIQAEWIESGDGDNPEIDTVNFMEGDKSGKFPWTFSSGAANFVSTPASYDIEEFTGAASGAPTKGVLGFWYKCNDYTKVTSFDIRIGSDSSNYASFTITPTTNDQVFYDGLFKNASIVGNPDWTSIDYLALPITQTASSYINIDGIRILTEQFFNHYPYVQDTPDFEDLRSPQLKPTSLMNVLAKTWNYNWYIDYDRSIYFFDREDRPSPFDVTSSSDNFTNLNIEVDQSQLGNRIIVRGGDKNSDNDFAEVFKGDNTRRVWKLKSQFADLSILIDDNSDVHAAEAGTTTTNIKITGHSLSTGDHVINRSRSDIVLQITKVDNDNFTVETVTGQTTGDNISFFSTSKTVGTEGLVDETTVDYVSNFNESTVRATESELTFSSSEFIRFNYFEKVPIELQYSDSASINAMKALGFGDGIFDLDPYTDRNIEDVGTALAIAQAKVREYSNPIIKGKFVTDIHGLRAGQIIGIEDSIRGIDTQYIIQKVKADASVKAEYSDYFVFTVTFGTTLFGIIEFFQKLLSLQDKVELNVNETVQTYVSSDEMIHTTEISQVAKDGGFKTASEDETIECSDVNTVAKISSWQFEPSTAQPFVTRFDLSSFT